MTSSNIPRPTSLLTTAQFSHLLGDGDGDDDASSYYLPTANLLRDDEPLPPTPTSLFSNALPRSLVEGENGKDRMSTPGATLSSHVPPRPRRLWAIQDTSLKPVPAYYPPLDPHCTCLVTDVSPSFVAVRISECLRKRSIAAEYDEEAVTARCFTVDRVQFCVQLYQGGGSRTTNHDPLASAPQGTVVVECQRWSGNVTSFHAACRAILQAAQGLDTGANESLTHRRSHANGLEFPSLKRRRLSFDVPGQEQRYHAIHPVLAAQDGLEAARELLDKDRLECQQLGMERLVNLTTFDIAGDEVTTEVSRQIVQHPDFLLELIVHSEAKNATATTANRVKGKAGRNPQKSQKNDNVDKANTALIRSFLEASAVVIPSTKRKGNQAKTGDTLNLSPDECKHLSHLRSMALRVLCNSLYNLSKVNQLQAALFGSAMTGARKGTTDFTNRGEQGVQHHPLVEPPVLLSLVQDLMGASRPPSVVEAGYKLASVHEAALAVRCLRLLAGNENDNDTSPSSAVREFLLSDPVLERLELARSCGRATHWALQQEAERTYKVLTEGARSC